jgi:sporulation protein YlmC with PRC-barrel domain
MLGVRSIRMGIAVAALAVSPVLAQQAETTNPAPPTGPTGGTTAQTATRNPGPSGRLQKTQDDWRASKLVGATVYNDQGDDIGSVDDLLVGQDGKIAQAVISVGGFLGIGSKLITVPYEQLKFEPNRGLRTAAVGAPAGGTADINRNTAGSGPGAPIASNPVSPPAASSMADRDNTDRPYFSVVLPGATKDSLTKMEEFRYGA